MTRDEIHLAWGMRAGPSVGFRVVDDAKQPIRHFVLDGPAERGMTRAWRSVPRDANEADVRAALDDLYADYRGAAAKALELAGKSFSEVLEQK